VEGEGQYLVMEHIPGQDLAQMLKVFGRPFAPTEVLRWADELLRVLEYLHGLNPPILHRDIKPSNLKLTGSGEVFLLDFGLAKGATGQMSTVGHGARSIAGYTPSYAPLEQILRSDSLQPDRHWVEVLSQINPVEVERILAAPTDERGDIYSLGATLYHLLTGVPPVDALTRASAVINNQPDPLRPAHVSNAQVPISVGKVIQRAMAQKSALRPKTAAEMREMLRQASGAGWSLRAWPPAGARRGAPPGRRVPCALTRFPLRLASGQPSPDCPELMILLATSVTLMLPCWEICRIRSSASSALQPSAFIRMPFA